MQTITATDLNDAFARVGLNDDEIFSSIATAGAAQPDPAPALKLQSAMDKSTNGAGLAVGRGPGDDMTEQMLQMMANAMAQVYSKNGKGG
jgi:hypothetical protein